MVRAVLLIGVAQGSTNRERAQIKAFFDYLTFLQLIFIGDFNFWVS